MGKMQTLTINGQEYVIDDKNAAKIEAQTLTDEQKAQARANIGAGTSTLELDANLADATKAAPANLVGEIKTSVEEVNLLTLPGSLKWDGVIGDRAYVVVGEVDESMDIVYVRMSEDVQNLILTDTYYISAFCAGADQEVDVGEPSMDDNGIINLGGAMVVLSDTTVGSVTLKKGIYFVCYSIIKTGIDASYLHTSSLWVAGNSLSENDDHFETVQKTVDVSVGETLTWDGVVGDRDATSLDGISCIRISDSTPTASKFVEGSTLTWMKSGELSTYTFALSGAETSGNFTVGSGTDVVAIYVHDVTTSGTVVADFVGFIAFSDGAVYVDTTFPKAGIYTLLVDDNYTSSIYIPGYNFITEEANSTDIIKYEHLPDALQFGDITTTEYGDTLEWDGDTTGLISILDDAGFRVSDAVPVFAECANGGSLTILKGTEYATVEFTEDDVKQDEDGVIGIAEGYVMIVGASAASAYGISSGTYFVKSSENNYRVARLTINGYSGFAKTVTEHKDIDEAYLPESVEGVVIRSSTEGSTKKFKVTVDDSGTLTATEVTE